MSETNIPEPNRAPQLLTELPIHVSLEQAQAVGDYLNEVLDLHGKPAKITVGGKLGPHKRAGTRAEFVAGKQKFTIEKMDDTDSFPQTVAALFEQTEDGKWQPTDRIIYDLDHSGALSYRSGNTMLYSYGKADTHMSGGVEKRGKRGMISVNTTPPTEEGLQTMLELFLAKSEEIAQNSERPIQKMKNLGKRALHRFIKEPFSLPDLTK